MKRLMIVVSALMVACLATPVYAEVRAGSFTVAPFLGGYTFDGEEHLLTRPVYGIRGGYNFTRHLGLEALFHYNATELTRGAPDNDADAYSYRLEGLYHFMPEKRLVPFVALVAGGITVDYPKALGPPFTDRTDAVFGYGGGLKYFLTDMVALRGDARHLLVTNGGTSNWEYTLGANFQFGGVRPAPAAAAPPPVPAPMPAPAAVTEPTPVPLAAEPKPGLMKYCVDLKVEFDIDKTVVRPQYHDEIKPVADFLRKYPSTTAVIEGHTDSVGDDAYNMELSQRRAESVVAYLSDNFGIDRSRLSAKGYGETRPLADNAAEEGKQHNRRVEAIIDCALEDPKVIAELPDRLCIALNVQFDTDKADVKPGFHSEIAKVGDFMNKYPTTTAVIEGHTDRIGSHDYNMKLSLRRAESVVNYLVSNFGIDRSRLSAKGYGFTRPVAYNTTAEGRALNRRINAIIDCVIRK